MVKLHIVTDEEIPENFTGKVKRVDGAIFWYQNGKLHCEDGPAVELKNGAKAWYQNGVHHRLDGAAAIWRNGSSWYYVRGTPLEKEEFEIFQFLWENTYKEKTEELMEIFTKLARTK